MNATAPHQQLHRGQLVISNTETLRHVDAPPNAQDWEVQITFTFAGAGSTVSGWGTTEQGAAIRAANALGELLASIEVDEIDEEKRDHYAEAHGLDLDAAEGQGRR